MKLISAFTFPEGSDTSPDGAGFMVGVGYRFSPWYAVQVDYQWGEMTDSATFFDALMGVGTFASLSVENSSLMASGKIYPFARTGIRFQPYGLIGLGVLKIDAASEIVTCIPGCIAVTASSDEVGFGMKYGGGADIHLTNRIYGFVDYAFYHSIQSSIKPFDFHAIGGGVGFRW